MEESLSPEILHPAEIDRSHERTQKILTLVLGEHRFGIPILSIEDVIHRMPITHVARSAPYIVGVMNLRGHIFTEISVAQLLGLPTEEVSIADDEGFSIIVSRNGEMYSLVFQDIGDVLDIHPDDIEKLPTTIDESWLTIAKGVYRMDKTLMVILDIDLLLDLMISESDRHIA